MAEKLRNLKDIQVLENEPAMALVKIVKQVNAVLTSSYDHIKSTIKLQNNHH